MLANSADLSASCLGFQCVFMSHIKHAMRIFTILVKSSHANLIIAFVRLAAAKIETNN